MLLLDKSALRITSASRAGRMLCLLAVMLLVTFLAPPASAQCSTSMYGSNYSDTWMVGHNQPTQTTNADGDMEISLNGTPSAEVKGYGSYEEPYNSCGHESTLDANLMSPAARAASVSGGGGSYARVDLGLEFLEGDPGDYLTSHETTIFCPIINNSYNGGGRISSRSIGVSFTVYEKVVDQGPTRALYQQIRPCNAQCGIGGATGNFLFVGGSLPPFFVVGVPFFRLAGFIVCENIITSYMPSATRAECGDIGIF